ncbi:nucleoside hydrolase [Tianweitania sp. BSSL-BM11]|uniref:Nucleoside hydrolase n=1 Tax=Tianweitania aestuarii TaxID=2814886 RepID=A0ABS5RYG1_9HYPH|nr:nucleoside hydrolase [Tianweitania aestuarii]MBS9722053.1 nucleoside hydrolase [Tianweitania aestuarii]
MSRISVIIDTDPGVDDAAAIMLALASPEIDLRGVTVVAGNVGLPASVGNACRIVALAGRRDVPVLAGAAVPLIGKQLFGKYAHIGDFPPDLMPETDYQPARFSAVRFIVEQARAAAVEGHGITICAMGPLTNIALALRMHPDVADGIESIVIMGGAFAALGHRTPFGEYNVMADPHAAAIVWQSGVPVVLLPLDVTLQALFADGDFSAMEAQGSPSGKALAGLLRRFDRGDLKRFGRPGGPIHDAMTIAWLLQPELFSGSHCAIGVTLYGPTAGQTWADLHNKSEQRPNACVMTHVDEVGYRRLLVERIAGLGAIPLTATPKREFHA